MPALVWNVSPAAAIGMELLANGYGWLVRKGGLAPVKLNWRDIRPLMSPRYHVPPSAHTTFLVVETDDAANLQAFLRPGANRCTAEITPVTDRPAS